MMTAPATICGHTSTRRPAVCSARLNSNTPSRHTGTANTRKSHLMNSNEPSTTAPTANPMRIAIRRLRPVRALMRSVTSSKSARARSIWCSISVRAART
jgi:hypothetical protein